MTRQPLPGARRSSRWIWLAAVLAVAVVVWAFGFRSRGAPAEPSADTPKTPAIAVSVVEVARRDVRALVQAAGSIQAVQSVSMSSKIPGRIASVTVKEGDRVGAGQVLVRLDDSDARAQLEQARAALEAARARLPQAETGVSLTQHTQAEQRRQAQAVVEAAEAQVRVVKANVNAAAAGYARAQSDYARVQALAAQGAVAAAQVEAARTAMEAARAQYEAAQAQLAAVEGQLRAARAALDLVEASAEQVTIRQQDVEAAQALVRQAQAAVDMAEIGVRNTVIRSPISGVVIQRSLDPGEYAAPGAVIVVVADLSRVEMSLDVSETDISRIRIGSSAEITVDSLPGRRFTGEVTSRAESADQRTRTFAVKVTLQNGDGALRPGMFGRGTVITAVERNALVVPEDALLYEGDAAYVFVVGQDNVAKRRAVTPGVHDGLLVQISGVAAGERVVVQGQNLLRDNTPVTVQ